MEKENKLKRFFGIYCPDVRKMCVIAMMTALTAVIGMYCTVRVGAGIKISFKFVSVYLLASMFGPLWGGLSCVISDILAYAVNPVAAFLPQITFSEFLYGFTDGLFYYGRKNFDKNMIIRIILCVTIEIIAINIFLTSYFLIPIMGLSYKELIIMRLPAAIINYAVRLALLISLSAAVSKTKIM